MKLYILGHFLKYFSLIDEQDAEDEEEGGFSMQAIIDSLLPDPKFRTQDAG